MSGREREHEIDQVGNLVPRDVVEVLALERHSSRGKRRRRRGGSIRRAFSWLRRGKKAKNAQGSSRYSQDLLSPGTPVLVPQPSPKAASKEEDVRVLVPQIFQENVFLEGNRHKYVEDLHSEAQQGLKLKQLEENNIDTDYQDDQSVISGVTSQNDVGSCSERRRSIGSESTATDSMSTVSTQSISSRSTRSALSRQGSTFTPLNQGKKERTRGRRKHRRTTVVGIPRHVQKELGLDRAAWTAFQRSQEPVPSEDFTGIAAIIPSAASAVAGTVSTSSEKQQAPRQPEARPKDDLALIQSALPQGSLAQRPKSVAVPWVTTATESGDVPQHPPSPVMYISPQATYLSKIIPNAVLPPSVDVVEINRNRTRNSVRTVSKCSLASASPAPSRASSRASSSRASSRRPTLSSVSSGWSRSDSSETLVSDSSTISSSSTARASSSGQESVVEARQGKANPRPNGQVKVMEERDQTTGQFTRSLSVMKRAKKPPPPSRSYSLHKDKMKRRSRDLAEVDFSGVKPKGGREKASGGSAGYSADESAQEESFSSGAPSPHYTQQQTTREGANVVHASPLNPHTTENGLRRNLSPSSGYSSHNGTPHTTGASPLNAAKRELAAVSSNHTKPAVLALKSLFEIPQPPKVTAPPPPPPETWAHNQRTFVLLCGPGPANIKFATPPKRLQTQHGEGEVSSAETPSSLSVAQQKHTTTAMAEQDSPSMNKRPSPLPSNLNLMQELQKVQQSPLMNRAQAKQVDAPTGPPLSPPLPPPPPPLEISLDCSLTTMDDLPPPPPLFSPVLPNASAKTSHGIPAGIPPPPQQPPPPPPQHPPPPPPVVAPIPKKDGSPVPQAPAQPNIPKAPPLPVNFKTQASLRKVPPPQKKDPPATSDDSSPVVTPSILQKVRLRSIKSKTPKPEQNDTESTVEQTDQKPAVSQVAPPKPIRRSLLLAEPPPDVAALIADEPKPLPDTTEQMSKTEAIPKNVQSETTVLNSQSEQPSVTPPLDSTISVSQPEATDLKSLPEPIASTPQAETSELPSQPEPPIPDSEPEQSNTPLEQSISVSDSQPVIKSKTEPTVLKSEEKQSESKSDVVSAVAISEPEQTTEIPKTPEPEHETSNVSPELVASNSTVEEAVPESKPETEAVAQTEKTPSPPETDSVVPKSEPEQTSEISQPVPDVPPPISEPDTSKPAPESSLSVAQVEDAMSKMDIEPAVLTDAPEPDDAESKPEEPPVTSTSEPEPAVPKPQVSSATTESNPGPDPTVSKSESVSTAAVSPAATTTTKTTTASTNKSLPTITISASQAASTAPKPQTKTPTPSTSPSSKSPPASMNSSMSLQEAIRQRAAARSANDGPAKRLSVHSPPATAGGSPLKSPTSTASFIFSKSTKKVVIDTPKSPEVQSSLRKTLQTELTAVSSQSNQGDGQKRVPPPVASKPRGKSQSPRNGLPNPSTEEAVTSDVQTAGQGTQSEDTRNTA
ncbi:uncharacterized protein KIAA1522 [Sardina pilchardus]|uniref:uncharacterized protein KIAA1522 n=1 Tax=Sardina pilchardus TaxID=27697 RepID=UPI002E135D6F